MKVSLFRLCFKQIVYTQENYFGLWWNFHRLTCGKDTCSTPLRGGGPIDFRLFFILWRTVSEIWNIFQRRKCWPKSRAPLATWPWLKCHGACTVFRGLLLPALSKSVKIRPFGQQARAKKDKDDTPHIKDTWRIRAHNHCCIWNRLSD